MKRSIFSRIIVIIAMILTLGFVSCKNEITDEEIFISTTPYASESELDALCNFGFVDYKVARFFALTEMAEFTEVNSWQNSTLSDFPIIIYNSETDEPRYYEFRVIKDGIEIGAIACVAQKSEGDPVQYVMPYATEVSPIISRSVINTTSKFVDVGYPSKLVSKNLVTNRSENATTEEFENYEVDIKVKDLLETATPELLNDLGITSDEIYNQYIEEQKQEEERIKLLWEQIYSAKDSILDVSDEEILDTISPRATTISTYFLNDWMNVKDWYNPGGYCGPNAMAFIALGLGESSGYKNIPTSNNYTKLRDFYKDFATTIGDGAKVFSSLSKGLSTLTDYKLSVDAFHSWNTISKNIKNTGLPSVSLRSSKSLSDLAWHYRDIIGTKTETTTTSKKFLWWTWTSVSNTNWYYMHDNGSDGQNFWEKAGTFYQFWSAHVVEE